MLTSLQPMGKDSVLAYSLKFSKTREILLTNPEFSLYISQPCEAGQDSKDLIIENPVFQPFSFKMEGMTGRIDDKRTRYSFDSAFRDLGKDSEGRISSLIVFNDKNEAYFESFTVNFSKPVEKTIRVQETEIEDTPDNVLGRLNRPKKLYQGPRPQEMNSKYRH